jgi:large subunit ribosomal protein L15
VTRKKILGRGSSTGHGGTSGKGNKGQNARSGGGTRPGFEGGQMPLYRRIARRGFSNEPFKKVYLIVNVGSLENRFNDGDRIDRATLVEKRLIKSRPLPVKLLGNGEISKKLVVEVDRASASAVEKIEKSGGQVLVREGRAKSHGE